ncbi:unnamed protein product [Calypogeia fissa]
MIVSSSPAPGQPDCIGSRSTRCLVGEGASWAGDSCCSRQRRSRAVQSANMGYRFLRRDPDLAVAGRQLKCLDGCVNESADGRSQSIKSQSLQ